MVEIEIYKRRMVEYNSMEREFQVWENDKKILIAPTQLEIEDMIDKLPEKPFDDKNEQEATDRKKKMLKEGERMKKMKDKTKEYLIAFLCLMLYGMCIVGSAILLILFFNLNVLLAFLFSLLGWGLILFIMLRSDKKDKKYSGQEND